MCFHCLPLLWKIIFHDCTLIILITWPSDGVRTTIPVGEECVINVNASEAGYGNVTCRIHSNNTADVDIDIVDNGDGTVSLMYTPRVPGAYTLNIKFGGQPVPNGQITQQVGRFNSMPFRMPCASVLSA